MAEARIKRQIRGEAKLLAKAAKIPQLDRIHVHGLVVPPNPRIRDPANWYPSFKAAIDGLVDAGVVPDDNPTHLVGPDMRLAAVVGAANAYCRHLTHVHLI